MNSMKNLMNTVFENSEYDLFPEIAKTLLYFTERLHQELAHQGVSKIFFLSREGQLLKKMFDLFQKTVQSNIATHYLEVSRRSTLLPSLLPLEQESFETLFRQYRRISLFEFLSSLGLESNTSIIAQELDLPEGAAEIREEDFPSSELFRRLKTHSNFQKIYEFERLSRRRAFIAYLEELSGDTLPYNLCIVDVGWKGTIQDNIFSLLCRNNETPVHAVTGFYVGLVAAGAANPKNCKYGLVFSSAGSITPKYRVFNENRALFEVILAANHGSIVSYEFSADGHAKAICGEFEESEMLAKEVFPVQHHVFKHFENMLNDRYISGKTRNFSFDDVVRAHARMVFNPTLREKKWFSTVFHIENYGVFERSYFSTGENRSSLIQRIRFITQLLRRRDLGALGFWPMYTLYERGGTIPALIYTVIRRLQK